MERVPQPQPALNKIQKEATLADPILEKKEVRENHEGGGRCTSFHNFTHYSTA